jgi:formylglycine-generating enzyme required for sulfatase activity
MTPLKQPIFACALLSLFATRAAWADAPAPYTVKIPGTDVTVEMVPIPGGTFQMGSPAKEKGRKKDEGPQHAVTVRPFYISRTEIPWEAYSAFLDIGMERLLDGTDKDETVDAITYPTPPYADETFGFGDGKQPAIALTVHAVNEFNHWLSSGAGKKYRLPTEAEWEYACRAGTSTAYSFGDKSKGIDDVAWYVKNSKKHPNLVGKKKPNPWGLLDMHGNVAEWVIDQYDAGAYARATTGGLGFVAPGENRFSHVVRGGGWKDKPEALRCAARRFSEPWWSKQDPQNPRSIWWHTESTDVGFRIVHVPDEYPELKGFRSRIVKQSL